MLKYPEKEELFRKALRQQILGRANLIKRELSSGTKFIYSESYPTQVLNTSLGRYIRINQADIKEETISSILKLMMGIDSYYHKPEHTVPNEDGTGEEDIPETTQDISEILTNAMKQVKEIDFTDLNTYDVDLSDEYESEYYEPEIDEIVKYDKFGNITEPLFNLVPQTVHITTKPGEDEFEFDPSKIDIDEGTEESLKDEGESDITSSVASLADMMGDTDVPPTKVNKDQKIEVYLEQAIQDLPQYEGISKFHSSKSILNTKDLLKLQPKVKQLLKAFHGKGDQVKLVTPTKRISSKDIASDRDKCYIRKTGNKGKHIKLNFLIDMSGSMGGSPIKNAVRLVYLFNQLAKEGYVTMSVLYSSTDSRYKLDLPASDAEVLALNNVRSAEGLAKTIEHFSDVIRGVNTICLTDGDIVDEAIDKTFWHRHKSMSTGIYVNKSLTSYTEYTGKLNTWFNHSIVRKNLDELIEWLIRTGLKG